MRKSILVGYPRSGTTSIARFFKQFDMPSHHQRKDPGKHANYPFNFLSFNERREYIDKKAEDIKTGEGFEASWELSYYMYSLHKECPEVKWIVMLRDPIMACNSLKKYRRQNADIKDLARHWNELYLNILEQSYYMSDDRKPVLMQFEKYIKGGYNEALFELFDIDHTKDNYRVAKEYLKTKVRSSGEYDIYDDVLYPTVNFPNQNNSIFDVSERIANLIRLNFKELDVGV